MLHLCCSQYYSSDLVYFPLVYLFPVDSHGDLYGEDQRIDDDDDAGGGEEEEEGRDDVMEVDQLIQEELGGWTEVKPHPHKEEEPKVHSYSHAYMSWCSSGGFRVGPWSPWV